MTLLQRRFIYTQFVLLLTIMLAGACDEQEYISDKSLAELNDDVFFHIQRLEYDEADSLANYVIEVAKTRGDYNSKINAQTQLAILYKKQLKTEEALNLLESVFELTDQYGTARQKVNILITKANVYQQMGEATQAMVAIDKAFPLIPDVEDYRAVAAVYGTKSLIVRPHDPAEALRLDYKALELFDQMNDKNNQSVMFTRLANIFLQLEDYDAAKEMLYQAIVINDELERYHYHTTTYELLARTYARSDDLEKAIHYITKSIESAKEYQSNRFLGTAYNRLGEYYADLGRYDEAIKALEDAKRQIDEWGDKNQHASNCAEFVKIYNETGNYRLMREHLDMLHELIHELESLPISILTWEMEANYQEAVGDYEEAIEAFRSYVILQDSLNQINRDKEVEEVRIAHEVDLKIAENELLQQELLYQVQLSNNQKRLLILLFVAVIVIGGFLVVIFRNKKHLERANRSLENKNQIITSKNIELERLNTELKQLNIDKGRLIDIIVHDLRNPLFGIISFLDVMDETVKDELEREYLSIAQKSAERLNKLIDSLLDVHSLEKNRDEPNFEKADIKDLVEQSVQSFKPVASRKNITLRFSSVSFPIETNKIYLSRILDNLISNAIKFSPEGKTVYVETRKKSTSQWQLVVKDEGPGFTENDKKRVFQMFGRLSARPTGNEDSTGLGLYAVKILLEKLDGYIVLESKKGEGAVFTCVFPNNYREETEANKGKDIISIS